MIALFPALFAVAMSAFFQQSPECGHGIHMHVIWSSWMCVYPGTHMIIPSSN